MFKTRIPDCWRFLSEVASARFLTWTTMMTCSTSVTRDPAASVLSLITYQLSALQSVWVTWGYSAQWISSIFSIYSKMQRKETETLLHEAQTPYVHHVSTFSSGLRLFLLNLLPLQRFTDTERSYSNRLLLTQQRWVEVGINYHSCADFTEIWWKFELHLDGHQAGDALQKWVDITVSFR